MYAYIGLAYYEQDLDNEYKERMELEDESTGRNDVGRTEPAQIRSNREPRQKIARKSTK